MKPELQIVRSLQRLVCTSCGAEANASCNCGKPYVPAAERVREYDEANPGQSTRQAAADLGVSKSEVHRARQAVPHGTPDTVTGQDGKQYPARVKVEDVQQSQDSEDEENYDVPDPAQVEENVHWYIERLETFARAFKKHFKASTFDRERADRIRTRIDRMIKKWQSAKSVLP